MTNLALSPAVAAALRALTPARVGLGLTGVSQQTRDLLGFQLAHAQARDAVHAQMQPAALAEAIRAVARLDVVMLHSAAADRTAYLQRPELGRRLDDASRSLLERQSRTGFDLALVIADGLSALAAERHAPAVTERLLALVKDCRLAPICIVEQGRVAIGDEIGHLADAKLAVVLIGERPGLSSPDSLGAYITWQPRPGRTDAERNCISNIRGEGLSYDAAAAQIATCLCAARHMQMTGVGLKLETREIGEGGGCCAG